LAEQISVAVEEGAVTPGAGYAHLRVWAADSGHVAIVTETGLGASTTNSAEHIWLALVEQYGHPLVLLEHYPAAETLGGESLDQVHVRDWQPAWRRIWPTPPENPGHEEFERWMHDHGHRLLGETRPA
jgi:hypothetical protein